MTDDDLLGIVRVLVDRAKGGDMAAIREVLTRTLGKPSDAIDPDTVETLELRRQAEREYAEKQAATAARSRLEDEVADATGIPRGPFSDLSDDELMRRLHRLNPEKYGESDADGC